MNRRKVLTILGTRPEAIKLAPVVMEFGRRPDRSVSRVCATAQPREMLDQALAILGIKPDFDLHIMTPGQSLVQVTARAMEGLDSIVTQEAPDVVLLHDLTPLVADVCVDGIGLYRQATFQAMQGKGSAGVARF